MTPPASRLDIPKFVAEQLAPKRPTQICVASQHDLAVLDTANPLTFNGEALTSGGIVLTSAAAR